MCIMWPLSTIIKVQPLPPRDGKDKKKLIIFSYKFCRLLLIKFYFKYKVYFN